MKYGANFALIENGDAGFLCSDVAKDDGDYFKILNPQSRVLLFSLYFQPFIAQLPVKSSGQCLHDVKMYSQSLMIIN